MYAPGRFCLTTLPTWLALSLVVTGCSGNGTSAPPPVVVQSTTPADGASEVEPDTTIVLRIEPTDRVLADDDVTVRDGGNRLPGRLERSPIAGLWTWTPEQELPRLGRIEVLLFARPATTFTVRDIVPGPVRNLGGERLGEVLAWPNGRSAVRTADGDVFEVRETGMFLRAVDVPEGARTFGDGGFVGEREQDGVRYCVRGNLDGSYEQIPLPFGAPVGDVDRFGDVVVLVPTYLGTVGDHGLWRLLRGDAEFSLAGAIALDDGTLRPSIVPDGTVAIAHRAAATRVEVRTFAAGDLVGTAYERTVATGIVQQDVHFDRSDDGRGVLAFTVAEQTQQGRVHRAVVARFDPTDGITPLQNAVREWSIPITIPEHHPFARVESVHAGAYGSAIVGLATGTVSTLPGLPTTNSFHELLRIEPDDAPSEPTSTIQTTTPGPVRGRARRTPLRAEQWSLTSFDFDNVFLARSRPGEPDEQFGLLYEIPPVGVPFVAWDFAVDDSGRAVLATEQYNVGIESIRIATWR